MSADTATDTTPGQLALPEPAPETADLPATIESEPRPWDAVRTSVGNMAGDLTPIEKAAIILSAIGPDHAAEFLKGMNENSLTRTAVAISNLGRVGPEVLDTVIAEFLLSIGTEEEVSGGRNTARRLLSSVLDDKTIEKIMFDVEGGDSRAAWKKLNEVGTATLASFVAAEHPQTAAVIVSELRPEKAAGVIERLDPEFAQQTLLRLSRITSMDRTVAAMVEKVITRDFLSAIQRNLRARKPADLIAGMMNNLNAETREHYLEFLSKERPQLHGEVIKTMFTFDDIRERVEPREVAIIAKGMDEPILLTALKWGQIQGSQTVDFFFENISKRLSERLAEDIASMPDPTPREGEAAHQDMVRKIQELAKANEINLIEDEQED